MAPVGSRESLHAALSSGADAVYFGVEGLNMRARSSANFTLDDLRDIAATCREAGVKTYLTVNTVIYDSETELLGQILDAAAEAGISAIIASDIAAISAARARGLEVHISTQCNITNTEAVRFYSQWADTVVLARELNLDQVRAIADAIDREDIRGPHGGRVKIEMFCHGALCMAVSGKCYLSLHQMNSSANRGSCTHRHRPRDGRPARHREPIYHVAARPEDHPFSRPCGRSRSARAENRGPRPRTRVCRHRRARL